MLIWGSDCFREVLKQSRRACPYPQVDRCALFSRAEEAAGAIDSVRKGEFALLRPCFVGEEEVVEHVVGEDGEAEDCQAGEDLEVAGEFGAIAKGWGKVDECIDEVAGE